MPLSASTIVACLVGGYLLGSIPFGVVVTRLGGAGDLRTVGSGNIGATNVLRTGRKDLAALTLLGDAGKGVIAVLVARALWGEAAGALAGGAAFVGHLFPIWLKFRGGKGVATALGVMLAAAWPVGLLALATWLLVLAAFRISSLSALVAAALSPAFALLIGVHRPILWLIVSAAVLVVVRHRANVERLLRGAEPPGRAQGHGRVNDAGARAIGAVERRDRLRLARTDGVGPVAWRELMRRYGSAAKALEALPHLARRGGRAAPLKIAAAAEADRELEAGRALGAELLTAGEPAFPPRLTALDPPPPVLWARGHAGVLHKPAVAIVGARVASAAGQRFARQLAVDLGEAGYVVVSGMARGVDGAAHEGGLAQGTVAVLAGGVDDIYPPEHAGLYDRIVAQGCVVSENAVGRRATARDFPRRNRIISGLSLGVVVVEAEARSGSLITARLAAEQGREVLAVPGSPLDPRARGTNDLIRQGATLCEGVEDVVRALEGLRRLAEPQFDLFGEGPVDGEALDASADRLRERAYALLSPTPAPRDELVRALHEPAAAVLAALVELSLAGRAELLPGGLVARAD